MNEQIVQPTESCRSAVLTQAAGELRSGKSNVCVNLATEVQSIPPHLWASPWPTPGEWMQCGPGFTQRASPGP